MPPEPSDPAPGTERSGVRTIPPRGFRTHALGWLQQGREPIHDALTLVGDQQRLDFLPERRVAGAADVEQGVALRRRAVDRVGKHLLNVLPAIRRHRIAASRADVSPLQLPVQPRARRRPLPLDGGRRHVQRLGGLLHRHPAVEAVFDDSRLTLVQRRQPRQRLVERQQFLAARLGHCPRRRHRGEAASVRRRASDGLRPTA